MRPKASWWNSKDAIHFLHSPLIYGHSNQIRTTFEKHVTNKTGLEIATDTVANATNIFSLATKNSSLVAKVETRFLYDLDLR